jgi:hypothetical protein
LQQLGIDVVIVLDSGTLPAEFPAGMEVVRLDPSGDPASVLRSAVELIGEAHPCVCVCVCCCTKNRDVYCPFRRAVSVIQTENCGPGPRWIEVCSGLALSSLAGGRMDGWMDGCVHSPSLSVVAAVVLAETNWTVLRTLLYLRGKCPHVYPSLQWFQALLQLDQDVHGRVRRYWFPVWNKNLCCGADQGSRMRLSFCCCQLVFPGELIM